MTRLLEAQVISCSDPQLQLELSMAHVFFINEQVVSSQRSVIYPFGFFIFFLSSISFVSFGIIWYHLVAVFPNGFLQPEILLCHH